MVFNFLPLHAPWTQTAWCDVIERVQRDLPVKRRPTWALTNHDVRRIRTRLGNEDATRAAADRWLAGAVFGWRLDGDVWRQDELQVVPARSSAS